MGDTPPAMSRLNLNDPRVNSAVSWVLTTAAGVAFSVGAYFFNDLKHSITDLATACGGLKVQIAVLEAASSRDAETERRVMALEQMQAAANAEREALRERIRALETKR
jgi:hypothetical protein